MKINKTVLEKLNPCESRWENYLKHYESKEFTIKQFLNLTKITFRDKCWVAFRLMPRESIPLCAADIAESVLLKFEEKYPNDNRPRLAIEAARSSTMSINEKNAAADAAAHATVDAAYTAARAAAHAAVDAAYTAARAAYAARAADAAARAADAAYAIGQKKSILNIIERYLK